MTTETLLTDIEHPGTVIVPSGYLKRRALSIHIHALQKLGHAIVVDETVGANGRDSDGDIRVYHYQTCKKCRGGIL